MDVQPEQLGQIFRDNFKARRDELGFTQDALAKALSVPQSYISDIERGRVVPNLLTLAKLAEVLDTTPSALISAVGTTRQKNLK